MFPDNNQQPQPQYQAPAPQQQQPVQQQPQQPQYQPPAPQQPDYTQQPQNQPQYQEQPQQQPQQQPAQQPAPVYNDPNYIPAPGYGFMPDNSDFVQSQQSQPVQPNNGDAQYGQPNAQPQFLQRLQSRHCHSG